MCHCRHHSSHLALSVTHDTVLYAVASLAAHGCVAPVPLCTLRLTVAALQNVSYTLLAAPDEGWQHPTALVDGQPQAGAVALGAFR